VNLGEIDKKKTAKKRRKMSKNWQKLAEIHKNARFSGKNS